MTATEVNHEVVSREQWTEARKVLLAKEKAFTRQRDELSRQRRELPWTKVEKTYVFDGPTGKETLAGLFAGRGQLMIYHFMFAPGWEEGCKSCSFLADHIDGMLVHLRHRDVTLLLVSRAPLAQIEAFKKRMGWKFKWVSSYGNDFNFDFHVSFTPEEMAKGEAYYNYGMGRIPVEELPGLSVFSTTAAMSTTPIPLIAAGWTYCWARIISSTWRQKVAMRKDWRMAWLGCATTIAMTKPKPFRRRAVKRGSNTGERELPRIIDGFAALAGADRMAVSRGHPGGFAEVSRVPGGVCRPRDRMWHFGNRGGSRADVSHLLVRGLDRLSGG